MTLLLIATLAIAGGLVVLVIPGAGPPPGPPHIDLAQDSCTANCNAQWNACRINTKGSAACDSQRAACMQACLPRKR